MPDFDLSDPNYWNRVAAGSPGGGSAEPHEPSEQVTGWGVCKKDGTNVQYGPPAYDGPTAGPMTDDQVEQMHQQAERKEQLEACEKKSEPAAAVCKRSVEGPDEAAEDPDLEGMDIPEIGGIAPGE